MISKLTSALRDLRMALAGLERVLALCLSAAPVRSVLALQLSLSFTQTATTAAPIAFPADCQHSQASRFSSRPPRLALSLPSISPPHSLSKNVHGVQEMSRVKVCKHMLQGTHA